MRAGSPRAGSARADLHMHSRASDGLLAPADLIRQAASRGLSIVALTDHDTTTGLQEAADAGERLGVRFIPGVELSTDVERGQLHVLGYGIDRRDPTLLATLESLRASRQERAQAIIEKLRELGVEIAPERVRPSQPGEAIGRPHIARAMIEGGSVRSIQEAFDRYIGDGGPAYVPSWRLTPEDAVRLVAAAGGIPVLAHPFSFPDFRERLPELIAAGLEGLEVYYGAHDAEQVSELEELAEKRDLLATGGSDFHGASEADRIRALGGVNVPERALERFLRRLERAGSKPD